MKPRFTALNAKDHTSRTLARTGIQSLDSKSHNFSILSHTGNIILEANFDYKKNLT